MVFVDIGANIGTMCIPMVARGYFAGAIAIEPEPLNARLLRSNVHLNDVADRIKVIEAAAGDSTGTATLFLSTYNFGDHCLKADQATMDSRESVQIGVRKLDDLIPPNEREHLFLWLDTQGYEGFVLKGGAEIITSAPSLVLEFCPKTLTQTGAYDALCQAVLKAPYCTIFDLAEAAPTPMPATAETLDRLFKAYLEKDKFTDLFFTT
ncbi:MAG TPA: FkbM family methyltransferase [Rhodobacteraceae bacterium]|nr:FkbM family methyltransferase [Paracoccaceae bacterium]